MRRLNWPKLGLGVVPATLMTAMPTFFFLLGTIIGVLLTPVFAMYAAQ